MSQQLPELGRVKARMSWHPQKALLLEPSLTENKNLLSQGPEFSWWSEVEWLAVGMCETQFPSLSYADVGNPVLDIYAVSVMAKRSVGHNPEMPHGVAGHT